MPAVDPPRAGGAGPDVGGAPAAATPGEQGAEEAGLFGGGNRLKAVYAFIVGQVIATTYRYFRGEPGGDGGEKPAINGQRILPGGIVLGRRGFMLELFGFWWWCLATVAVAMAAYGVHWLFMQREHPRFVVLVLGDLGHSPRMQYHVRSLSKLGYVDFVGYPGSDPVRDVKENPRVRLRYVRPFRSAVGIPYVLYAACRVLWESAQLAWLLVIASRPRAFLVQNPPAIPSLLWVAVAAMARGAPMVVDWHNFGYTMMAMHFGDQHRLVRLSYHWERFFSRFCRTSFCVSKAMQDFLLSDFKTEARTMYDRPPEFFRPFSEPERDQLWTELKEQGFLEGMPDWPLHGQQRPFVLVSSTSWSPDENFDMLLEALPQIDQFFSGRKQKLLVAITGKGPLKDQFLAKVARMELAAVCVLTMWLPIATYPRLLASADFGLSLHASSSGLDLPMKVVDMFGAGLPVLALEFGSGSRRTIAELVTEGEDGILFSDSSGLAAALARATEERHAFSQKARQKFEGRGWQAQWDAVARPIFLKF